MVTHESNADRALLESLGRLQAITTVASGVSAIQDRAEEVTVGLIEAIVRDVGAFSDTANPKILPLLEQHAAELVTEYLALLGGQSPQSPTFVERFASEAAEQYFPLEALLHAYRVTMRELLRVTTAALMPANQGNGTEIITAVMPSNAARASLDST